MPSSKLGQYWANKKERKELKKRYESGTEKFRLVLKEAAQIAGGLPEKERKTAQALLLEFNERFTGAKLEKELAKKVSSLDKLVQDVENWKNSTIPKPPPLPPLDDQPLAPVAELKSLLGVVQGIVRVAGNAAFATSPLLDTAIQLADPLVKDNANPSEKDVNSALVKLRKIAAAKDDLQGFLARWATAAQTENQALAALPQGTTLFDAIHQEWDLAHKDCKSRWEKMAGAELAQAPGQLLGAAERKAAEARKRLLGLRETTEQGLAKADKRKEELSVSNLCDLVLANKKLALAHTQFDNAADEAALAEAAKTLEAANTELERAAGGLEGAKGEALAQFNKLRRQVIDQLAKARLLRGATTEGSKVKQAIDDVQGLVDAADLLMKKAVTSGQATEACAPLNIALNKKLEKTAETFSKQEKKQANADLEAIPKYQKAFEELTAIRARVAEIPGGHQQLQLLDALIVQVRVGGNGQPPGGFAAALKKITDAKPNQLETAAGKAAEQYTSKTLTSTAVVKLTNAKGALDDFAKCATEFDVAMQRRLLAAAVGSDDPATAIQNFTEALREKEKANKKAETELKDRSTVCRGILTQLVKDGLAETDPTLVALNKQLDGVDEAIAGWRLADAERALDAAEEMSTSLKDDYEEAADLWKNFVSPDLARLEKIAAPLKNAPQTRMVANSIVVGTQNILDAVKNGLPLQEAIVRANRVLQLEDDLIDAKTEAGLEGGDDVLGAYGEAAKTFIEQWGQQVKLVRERLVGLDQALKKSGVKGGIASTTWPALLAEREDMFPKAAQTLKVAKGDDPKTVLTQLYNDSLIELHKLRDAIPDGKDTQSQDYQVELKEAKATENLDERRKIYDAAKRLLAEVEADTGVMILDMRVELGEFTVQNATAERAKAWAEIGKKLLKRVEEKRAEVRKQKVPAQQEAAKLEKDLAKKLLDRQSVTFDGLFEDLRGRLADAKAMLDTDDAELIAAGTRQIEEIRLTLTEAKGKGDKGAITLSQVQKRWADLSLVLGFESRVQERLPTTHKQLKADLDAAIEIAKRSAPDQGMEALNKLARPVLQAVQAAKAAQVRYDGFKLARTALEELLDKVKEHTGTTLLGGRMKAYNERFGSQVNDAHALARQEGQMDAAFAALKVLEDELNGFLSQKPDQAREELQSRNAEAEDEQRELRDMARTWNETQAYWEKTLLEQVDKAVKKRGEEQQSEAQSLRAALLAVGRTLEPYLAVVSKVPHKRGGSNGAPDMKVARGTFTQANLRLAQLQKVAQRLRDGGGSTNVELARDLTALEQEWGQRVQSAQAALTKLANHLKALPDQGSSTVADTDASYLSDEDKKKLVTAAGQIEPVLSRLSTRFQPTAFTKPLAVLRDDKASPEDRRKAREEALRTTRALAADIAANPLLRSLFDGAGRGLLEVDVRPQLSLLRAGLKKIELAVLVGV